MEVNNFNAHKINILNYIAPKEAMQQIAGLCQQVTSIDLMVAPGESAFYPTKMDKINRNGILSIHGRLADDSVILVRIELVRGSGNLRVNSASFFKYLSTLSEKIRLIPPQEQAPGQFSLWVELKVKASPMSMTRSSTFIAELKHLDELAKILQAELPINRTYPKLVNLYKGFAETLEPVNPWPHSNQGSCVIFMDWARETIDFLIGSSCVAIASPFPVLIDFALAILAQTSQESGRSIGRLLLPMINAKLLVSLTKKAPGAVVIPAVKISLGTSPYELGNEMRALLATLSNANTPAIFTGTHEELQAVFHGGQGGSNDTLFPVLRHIPDVPLELLARFTVQCAGQKVGGLPGSAEEELTTKMVSALNGLSLDKQKRILPMVANRMVHEWNSGRKISPPSITSFASSICGLSESLAGLPSKPRISRPPNVQERFTEVLTDPELISFFKEHLLGQDRAVEQLVARLRMECLTRPLYQPIRYCAQGTPATGKSESASLLARRLGIPYINIDAASLPDYHTAAAQLLGAGRGIVGSHQSGRLEQAAKHHTGVVVEVSDLDHASPSVRSTLADLFLQVLETGEAQSATGAMFSCANLIFAFTMNLPGGLDEEVHKGIGFNNRPSRQDVNRRVALEIKNMLSSAFLSRVGKPILFEPLDRNALAVIIERAIKKAVIDAAERLHCCIRDVILDAGLGSKVISNIDTNIRSFGARSLLEQGRSMAAEAFTHLQQGKTDISGKSILISASANGKIFINLL